MIEVDLRDLEKNKDKKLTRKFKEVKETYKNPNGIKENLVIYTVYIKHFGNFETGLTVIEPGTVNGEYYMTKGHNHKISLDEIYIPLSGEGKLLIENKKTKKTFNLKQNKIYHVPGKSGHRLINTGNKKLRVLTIYNKEAGHNYSFNFTKRFFKNKK